VVEEGVPASRVVGCEIYATDRGPMDSHGIAYAEKLQHAPYGIAL
jgi:hypothetical protein